MTNKTLSAVSVFLESGGKTQKARAHPSKFKMAFWGVEVKPGKPFTLSPDKAIGRLRISQATLGYGSANTRSLVQCNMGKKLPVLLCCLLPGVLETCHLELEFHESEAVIFSVIGARSVHLTGYYLPLARSLAGIEESESFGEDIGDTDTEKSDGCNDEDEYEDSFIDDGEPEVVPSSPSSNEVPSKKKTKKKKDDSSKRTHRRLRKKYELSESEDDYVPCDDNTGNNKIRGQVVLSDDDDDQCPIASVLGNGTAAKDLNREVCMSSQNQSERKKGKREKRKSDKEKEASAANNTDEDQSEDNRVKKKRKSGAEDEAVVETVDENESEEKKGKKKKKNRKNGKMNGETKTLSGGIVIEELDPGNPDGEVAASGDKVTIHYTGKLKEGGQVFDSSDGKFPLKFRLGKGHALDGLDVGIQGMRTGGKRRILIPPAFGYGDEGSEKVPPKAWLVMDVELLKVR